LPPRATRALSEIVATNLLEVLASRSDFDAALAQDLRDRLTSRLVKERKADVPRIGTDCDKAAALARAQKCMDAGELDEGIVMDAVRAGDINLAVAALAVAARVPVAVVERAASLRSLKGLVSLTWRAGFSMRLGTSLQLLLARVAPTAVLQAGLGGSFPLTIEEMRWQLDFLARIGR
jgi:hypothetical protein